MNFQSVKAAPGQYIQLQAAIVEIKHQSGEYGDYALGKAQDNTGQVEQVMFTCKKEMQFPTGLAAGHSCNWAGKYDANTQRMKLFFGSMAQRDVAAQAPATPPPQAPPPTPPAAPYHEPAGRDATGVSIERQCVVKAVGEIASRRNMDLGEAIKWCCHLHKWVETGQDIPVMAQREPGEDAPPPTDDDTPW
jgi:hypothetical protein